MKILIDKNACINNGYSISEALALLIIGNDINYKDALDSLISKGLITAANSDRYRLTKAGVEAINNITIDSIPTEEDEETRLTELANKLREIYPTGRKEGTAYMWRGTVAELVRKFKTLQTKYNFKFTDEQAIKATQTYVSSFNGDYRFMQLLKYFILKAVRDEDGNVEIKSEFMSLIENEGQETTLRNNWMNTLA